MFEWEAEQECGGLIQPDESCRALSGDQVYARLFSGLSDHMCNDTTRRELLGAAVRQYLAENSPHRLEEFDVVFADVYEVIARRLSEDSPPVSADASKGLPFDASMVFGTTVTKACWIGMSFLTEALATGHHDLTECCARIDEQLAKFSADRDMAQRLRIIIEGLLAS